MHDLYLKFTGYEGFIMNINYFTFGKEALPINGRLIKNLVVYDDQHTSGFTITDNADVCSLIFEDRDFTFTSLSDDLKGAEVIRTACDSKAFVDTISEFIATEDITVYIAADTCLENIPKWLVDWTKTELTVASSNDVNFNIYKNEFKSGEKVTLDGNGQASYCVNYTVLVK